MNKLGSLMNNMKQSINALGYSVKQKLYLWKSTLWSLLVAVTVQPITTAVDTFWPKLSTLQNRKLPYEPTEINYGKDDQKNDKRRSNLATWRNNLKQTNSPLFLQKICVSTKSILGESREPQL